MPHMPFYAQAEKYSHREIGQFTSWHPQAPRSVEENMLLIGTAGTGKSMVMRQLVAAYENSDEVYPLYIHAEDWLSDTLAENATRTDYASARFEGIRTKSTILFTLAIIERLISLNRLELAYAAGKLFRGAPDRDSPEALRNWADALREWLNDTWIEIKGVSSSSKKWRARYAVFASLSDVLTFIGRQTQRILGRRLVLFVDQLDKVGPAYFEVLGSAFIRTVAYTICLATRPSVCAPNPTNFDARIGNNRQIWLGSSWDSEDWPEFLTSATETLFDERTRAILRGHRKELAELVGPSTRQFMEIAKRLSHVLLTGSGETDALEQAVKAEIADYQGRMASCLVGVDTFAGLTRELNARLVSEHPDGTVRLSTIELVPSDGLILNDETISRLRVLVREGLLVPHDAPRYGVDNVGYEYRVVAQGISPTADWRLPLRSGSCEVDEQDFMSWSVPNFKRKRLAVENSLEPSVFYSHWMSETNSASRVFLEELSKRLAPDAFVTTGKKEHAHPHLRRQVTQRANQNIADHIRKNIEIATAVVVQLDNPRPAIGVELGWAISFGRPLFLAYASQAGFGEIPDWLKIDELNENGTPYGRERLITLIEEELPALASRKSPVYLREGDAVSTVGSYERDLDGSLIIGSGADFQTLVNRAGDRSVHFGYLRPEAIDTAHLKQGRLVPHIVARARRAATLLVVLSGERDPDILTWLALGAFSYKDSDTIRNPPGISGQRTLRRDFVLYSSSDWSTNIEPSSMVRGLSGYVRSDTVDDAISRYLENQQRYAARLRQ